MTEITEEWLVACLCAEWCGSCREYRAVFERAARDAAAGVRFAWIDIEDHPEVMGDFEVESFPSLLFANGSAVAFLGAVMPHASTLSSLVRRAMLGQLSTAEDRAVAGIAQRARALPGD